MTLELNNLKDTISLLADVLTLLVIIPGGIWGFLNRNKNVLGFNITLLTSYMLKSGLIILALALTALFVSPFYDILLIIIKGDSTFLFWEKGKEVQHILTYFILSLFAIPLSWCIITSIWTSSFKHALALVNLIFRPQKSSFRLEKERKKLEIIEATYGTDNLHLIDVTKELQQMIRGNKLQIQASNSLAGDPHRGETKKLKIRYKIDGKQKEVSVKEKDTVTIPARGGD